jgi:hypothetical protein
LNSAPKLRAALFMTLVGMVTLPGCVTHERQVRIDAPAACVWQAFQEVEHFPEWNPFFTHVDGKLDVGTHPTLPCSQSARVRGLGENEPRLEEARRKGNRHLHSFDSPASQASGSSGAALSFAF